MSVDELIHSQTSKIGLIAAEISKTLAAPEFATRENVLMLTQKLEAWRMDMPVELQIPTLTSDNPPELTMYQRRAILMVHVSYTMALFRRIMLHQANFYRSCILVHLFFCIANSSLQQLKVN